MIKSAKGLLLLQMPILMKSSLLWEDPKILMPQKLLRLQINPSKAANNILIQKEKPRDACTGIPTTNLSVVYVVVLRPILTWIQPLYGFYLRSLLSVALAWAS